MRGNTTKALKTLLIIKSHESSFFPALIEMSKLYLAMGNFALAEDASRTASAMATNHIEARYILTMTKFLSRSDKKERHICLGKLVQLCRDQEVPFSSKLWLRFVQQFPRLCGHDLSALRTICDSMAKDSISQLNDSAVLIEYARILRCVGRYHDSISHYELASQIDDSIKAEGMVLCQALIGDLQQAKYQIEFFELVHEDDPW
jgi:tetratricopeptide (TPR) repeat protein